MLRQILFCCLCLVIITGCNKYEKRGGKVYYNFWNEGNGHHTKELDGVNADKFKVSEFSSYAKDDHFVFYDGTLITNADAKSFEAIGDYYAHDKYRGYYAADSIPTSKGKSFKIINDYYTTDGNDVFFMQKPLNMVAAMKFRFVYKSGEDGWERWTTDGLYYYYMEFRVPSNDYKHMKLYKKSGGLSKDSRWVYFLDHKLNYSTEGVRIVDTIDVASFKVTGLIECSDKFGCFNVFHGRKPCNQKF